MQQILHYHGHEKEPRTKLPFLLLLFVLALLLFKASFTYAQQVAKVTPAGTKLWVYTPPGYNPSATTTYPVLVVLHGGAEIGDDLNKLTTGTPHQFPSRLIYLKQWSATLPFIVVSPQLKRDLSIPNYNDQEWPANYVNEVVEYVKKSYKVDALRMYFTGISLGAAGCWDYAAAFPTKVAALLPISGKTDVTIACKVKNIPVWAFHGENDGLVKPQFSVDMLNAINKCSPVPVYKPRLNLLLSRIHEGWNEIYNGSNGYNVYSWLLKFRKNNTANKTPYVNAGIDRKILLRTTSFHITGDYFDSDGTISKVAWTQTSGVALTKAGTNTRFLKLTGLKAGIFEFQLAVTDNKGGVSTDRVKLEIVSTSTNPAVTGLVLMNGKTNADIGPITEGQVINMTTLKLTEVNIKAIATTTGTGSVRLSINSDQNTRTPNKPGPYLIRKQASAAEWTIKNGDYVICATPYTSTAGKGTPGISQCFKITVTNSTNAKVASAQQPLIREEGDLLIADREEGIQWTLNGDDIPGANTNTITPSISGEYAIRIIDGTDDMLSNKIDFNLSEKLLGKIQVYPNPVTNYVRVEGVRQELGVTSYVIVNWAGQELQRGELEYDTDVAIRNQLPKGMYTLLLNNERSSRSIKFIVE